MLSYLQKFNKLPKDIKDAVASTEATAQIVALGKKYQLDLAVIIMKIVTKEVALEGLSAYFVNQFSLSIDQARSLEKDLRKYVFSPIIDYLLGPAAGPKLVFSENDEKEVKATAQPVSTIDFDKDIEEAIGRIIIKARINFIDPLLGAKFKQVIKTYLRGTRDKITTLEALTKASELGGVALSRDAAERALSLAFGEFNELKKFAAPLPANKISVPEDKLKASPFQKVVRESDYDLATVLKNENKLKDKTEPVIDIDHELAPVVPVVATKIPAITPAPAKKIIKEVIAGKPLDKNDIKKITTEPKKPAPVVNLNFSSTGKVRMDDIRFTPQVLGPIDELKYMTVKNFRRLDPDPLKATKKIKEKLELLGREDYAKKIEGIVAWQESPLSKLYLSLCRQALDSKKPVLDILKQELINNPNSLRSDELSAIISLNHTLKF
jgi:hypothetical protein